MRWPTLRVVRQHGAPHLIGPEDAEALCGQDFDFDVPMFWGETYEGGPTPPGLCPVCAHLAPSRPKEFEGLPPPPGQASVEAREDAAKLDRMARAEKRAALVRVMEAGELFDKDIAAQFGVSEMYLYRLRKARRMESRSPHSRQTNWLEET